MGRFKLKGRFKPPRALRKMQFGGLARQALGFIPGGSAALSLYDMAGDPKQLKRGVRAAKKGQHAKASRHVAKAKKPPSHGAVVAKRTGNLNKVQGAFRKIAGGLGVPGGVTDFAFPDFKGPKGGGASFGGHRRRMNVGNVKALRRSVRRVEGFVKLAKKTVHLTQQVRMKHTRGRKR